MTGINTIFAMMKTVACAAFALALVILPPSALHASTDMHGGQHSVVDVAEQSAAHQNHDMSSSSTMGAKCGSTASSKGQDHLAGKCCGGICSSVVLNEVAPVFVVQTTSDRYVPLRAQASSIEPSGFLRPPQSLI
jgi:hypothetical protein